MRQHDTGDAGQRQRRAEHRQRGDDQDDVEDQRDVGEEAEQAVGDHHEGDDEDRRDDTGGDAGTDRVGAEARAHRALFDHVERGRQRTGAQQHAQGRWRSAGVKLPVIWPEPPVIGCWMTGAVIT